MLNIAYIPKAYPMFFIIKILAGNNAPYMLIMMTRNNFIAGTYSIVAVGRFHISNIPHKLVVLNAIVIGLCIGHCSFADIANTKIFGAGSYFAVNIYLSQETLPYQFNMLNIAVNRFVSETNLVCSRRQWRYSERNIKIPM